MNIKSRTNIVLWLFSGCFLIFVMVVVGGITRLTGSGLSITKWDVVTGSIPPLTEVAWEQEFGHYQQTPQFHQINSHFGLEDFKEIYWWEYIHRLIGRVIGIVFIVPFFWFLVTQQLNERLALKCLVLFFMGALQGFVGWYMVKSGLVNIPSVSHFRLALHLITAFATFGLTFWFAFELIHTERITLTGWHHSLNRYIVLAFTITVIQIIYGAFVAGLKAGYIYNTWPLMGDQLVAGSVIYAFQQMGFLAFFEDPSGVQVVHRYVAIVLALVVLLMWIYANRRQRSEIQKLTSGQKSALNFVLVVVLLQFFLGILTLIYHVPVVLGVLHQVGAFLLFSSMIYLMHRMRRQSVSEARLT